MAHSKLGSAGPMKRASDLAQPPKEGADPPHSSSCSEGSQRARDAEKGQKKRSHAIVYGLDFMDFDSALTPEEREFRRRAEHIMDKLVRPHTIPLYENAEFDQSLFVGACKQFGPAGLQIKGYGCPGLTHVQAMLLSIEMSRVDASFATFYLVHCGLAMQSIAVAGTDEQKAYWLPKMSRLEKIGSFALTEPSHGSDATGMKTTARRVQGGKGWILNGSKRWIGNATFADLTIVWARDEATDKIYGFLVEKSFPGFKATKIENKTSLRIVQNADISLKDCYVPETHRLERAGFGGATSRVLESSRAIVAAECVGLLLGAYDNALKYCLDRTQFKRPLAGFQLVQERLMRVLGVLQASLLLVLRLGRLMDEGKKDMMPQIALTKATCSRLAREGISLCREVQGGNGIVTDFGVAKFHADIEALYTYEGTYDINMLVAGRAVTGVSALK